MSNDRRYNGAERENRAVSWLLLGLNELLIGAVGAGVGYLFGDATAGGGLALGLGAIAAGLSHVLIRGISGAKPFPPGTGLEDVVATMCRQRDVPVARLLYIEDEAPNAMAYGWLPGHCSIAVTTGLLATMDGDEVLGVLSHEISHLANHDTLITTLAVGTVNLFHSMMDLVKYTLLSAGRTSTAQEGALLAVGAVAEVPLLLSALTLRALSRRREELADLSAAEAVGPTGLRRALEQLATGARPMVRDSRAIAHLYISDRS